MIQNINFLKLVILGVILTSAPQRAHADDLEGKLLDCMSVSEDSGRLECFESLTQNAYSTISTVSSEGNSKWRVTKKSSPIDDSVNVFMHLSANEMIKGRYGDKIAPSIIIRCKENETEMYITWDMYLGIGDVEVIYRFDKETAQTADWSVSTTREASFVNKPISFIKSMIDKDSLLLRVTPYGESPVTATFPISGLKEAIVPLQESCKWN